MMPKLSPLWFFATLLATQISGPALAQDKPWHAAFMATWIEEDKDRQVDDGFYGFQLSVGKDLGRDWALDLAISYFSLDSDVGDDDVEQFGVGFDLLRSFKRSEYFSPYIVFGAGYLDTNRDVGKDEDGPMVSAGMGFLSPVKWRDASLRAEVRVRQDYGPGGSGLTDYLVNLGLQFPFNPNVAPTAKAPVEKPEEPPLPGSTLPEPEYPAVDPSQIDSDGDGVPDDTDMCGGTPAGRQVDKYGCATGGPVD